jgi:hypothetical protein
VIPVELQDVLMQALLAVLTLAVAFLTFYGKLYLQKLEAAAKLQIGVEQYEWAKSFAYDAVQALAQNPAFANCTGAELKEWAVSEMLAFCEVNKLPFGEKEIDILIEQAVKTMKEFSG